MNLIISTINREINSLAKNGVRIKIIGDLSELRKDVKKKLVEVGTFYGHRCFSIKKYSGGFHIWGGRGGGVRKSIWGRGGMGWGGAVVWVLKISLF